MIMKRKHSPKIDPVLPRDRRSMSELPALDSEVLTTLPSITESIMMCRAEPRMRMGGLELST